MIVWLLSVGQRSDCGWHIIREGTKYHGRLLAGTTAVRPRMSGRTAPPQTLTVGSGAIASIPRKQCDAKYHGNSHGHLAGHNALKFWMCLMALQQVPLACATSSVPLPADDQAGILSTAQPKRRRNGRKSMSRRSGQNGTIVIQSGWYRVRWRMDVEHQEA